MSRPITENSTGATRDGFWKATLYFLSLTSATKMWNVSRTAARVFSGTGLFVCNHFSNLTAPGKVVLVEGWQSIR